MLPEVWTLVPGFETRYLVSTRGNVMNHETGKPLKVRIGTNGYPYVMLYRPGGHSKPHWRAVHKLMAGAFLRNPDGLPTVDHIDRDKTNNVVENLRFASMSLQNHNREKRAGARSRYFGVTCYANLKTRPWVAQIGYRGVHVRLGRFDSEEEAARAYDTAARERYGDHARQNNV